MIANAKKSHRRENLRWLFFMFLLFYFSRAL